MEGNTYCTYKCTTYKLANYMDSFSADHLDAMMVHMLES